MMKIYFSSCLGESPKVMKPKNQAIVIAMKTFDSYNI